MKRKCKLPPRQKQTLRVIARYIDACGFPPTVREIGDLMGIRSVNGVIGNLKKLEARGLIQREFGKRRGIRIVDEVSP